MLEIANLSAAYGGIAALTNVSLSIPRGSLVALIGSNGAGKSTLLKAVSGSIASKGDIVLDGMPMSGLKAYQRACLGLIQVPEGRRILGPLTVLENLELGHIAAGRRSASLKADLDRVFDLFPRLRERVRQAAGSMSGGEQQMLAIGRGLMAHPKVLLLDEPSLGLAPIVVSQVFAALKELNRSGMTLLLVEQNARLALETSSDAYVIDRGSIVEHAPSASLRDDPKVIAHYLGGSESAPGA